MLAFTEMLQKFNNPMRGKSRVTLSDSNSFSAQKN